MELTSPHFENSGKIPAKYTCDGENINPALDISGVPEEAKSLVLIMDDPDAPMGTWDHWITFNIPPNTSRIEEGFEPGGISGKGTSGNLEYSGPCPPDGEHNYIFKLYALNTILDLEEGVSKEKVIDSMKGQIVAEATLTGSYSRS